MSHTPTIQLVDFKRDDLEQLHKIFYESVHGIGVLAYTKAQCDAWAPADFDSYYWSIRLKHLRTLFAQVDGEKVGFISYRSDGYIDFLYVLPDWKGRNIAQTLYNQAEFELLSRPNVIQLSTDASYLAKPFFQKNGFHVTQKNEVYLRGETLINFTMKKTLWSLS